MAAPAIHLTSGNLDHDHMVVNSSQKSYINRVGGSKEKKMVGKILRIGSGIHRRKD